MSFPSQWRKDPKPDPDVLELLHQLQMAAQKGHIRALAVIAVNPALHVEPASAGGLDPVRKNLLIGGLTTLANKLASE